MTCIVNVDSMIKQQVKEKEYKKTLSSYFLRKKKVKEHRREKHGDDKQGQGKQFQGDREYVCVCVRVMGERNSNGRRKMKTMRKYERKSAILKRTRNMNDIDEEQPQRRRQNEYKELIQRFMHKMKTNKWDMQSRKRKKQER